VALTFDDGPNPDATPRILDTSASTVCGQRSSFSAGTPSDGRISCIAR
jgi:hypothetical protein